MSKHLSRVDIIPGTVSLILYELIIEVLNKDFALIMILIIKSGHNFAHVMTAVMICAKL